MLTYIDTVTAVATFLFLLAMVRSSQRQQKENTDYVKNGDGCIIMLQANFLRIGRQLSRQQDIIIHTIKSRHRLPD